MPYYRCYILGGGNKIVAVEDDQHSDDNAGLEWADRIFQEHPDCTGVELWQGARLVHRRLRPGQPAD
ncbi:MAG TPA: hypothetical protein VGB82_13520 [Alphaproteobacteria bacterium]